MPLIEPPGGIELVAKGTGNLTSNTAGAWETEVLSLGTTLGSDLTKYLVFLDSPGSGLPENTSDYNAFFSMFVYSLSTTSLTVRCFSNQTGRTSTQGFAVYKVLNGSVQRGVTTISMNGHGNYNITISSVQSTSNAFVRFLMPGRQLYSTGNNNSYYCYIQKYTLTSTTNLQIYGYSNTSTTFPISWQIWDPKG